MCLWSVVCVSCVWEVEGEGPRTIKSFQDPFDCSRTASACHGDVEPVMVVGHGSLVLALLFFGGFGGGGGVGMLFGSKV